MARLKVLKGVVHNIGHSFISLMNYAGDDYVMGHVLRLARATGCDSLTIDFVNNVAGPPELLVEPISGIPAWYTKRFWDLVESSGSARTCVQSASLTLKYDLDTPARPLWGNSGVFESPYTCEVRVIDSRGVPYLAHFNGWWHPEPFRPSRVQRFLAWLRKMFDRRSRLAM